MSCNGDYMILWILVLGSNLNWVLSPQYDYLVSWIRFSYLHAIILYVLMILVKGNSLKEE